MVRRRAFSRTQHTLAHRLHTQRTLYVSEIGRDMSWLAGGEYPKQTGCRSCRTIIIFCLFLCQLINLIWLIWWCLRHFCSYGTQEYWVRRKHTTAQRRHCGISLKHNRTGGDGRRDGKKHYGFRYLLHRPICASAYGSSKDCKGLLEYQPNTPTSCST